MATHSSIFAWWIPWTRGAWETIVHGVTESDTTEQHFPHFHQWITAFVNRCYIFKLIYFNWRLITLQYYGDFCHTFTWISHGCTCAPILKLPPSSPSPIPSLRVIPVHGPWVLRLMHWTWKCTYRPPPRWSLGWFPVLWSEGLVQTATRRFKKDPFPFHSSRIRFHTVPKPNNLAGFSFVVIMQRSVSLSLLGGKPTKYMFYLKLLFLLL